ncbi:MAG: hypothetical protein COS94_09630 [Candidatus Hydrogenedentes bacterium CG07_land_8_20_14_0_80_42_17]|nr:MAG: hypothetical protein AUJ18_07100 [Candidatus Hydrogenedentes bacterium CG1_02_42_14]PIU46627.1 MAG: hypothetical protein COS94_09630 [Candidatus Hydrogenedentes bacterium CG07_land_8_20_14_0_80_42_17]
MLCRIEKIVNGGWGLARTDGKVVFIRAVIPGEIADVKKYEEKKGILWATEFELTETSPERISSECPYFPLCGGCDFQHMSYSVEQKLKLESIREVLKKICGESAEKFELKWETGIDIPIEEYRNTIRMQGEDGYLGFCKKSSNDIVDIEDCRIAARKIRDDIAYRKALAKEKNVKSITWRVGSGIEQNSSEMTVVMTSRGNSYLEGGSVNFKFGEVIFHVSPNSFFQVNLDIAEQMVNHLKNNLPNGARLFDLFAGVGTFALCLKEKYEKVIGMEISRDAVNDFQTNIKLNSAKNIEFQNWDAARGLKEPLRTDDIVILDPPRTGLPEKLIANLLKSKPRKIAYVSCDPATFARDLKSLFKADYRLDGAIHLFDMFPRTAHVELLAILNGNEK